MTKASSDHDATPGGCRRLGFIQVAVVIICLLLIPILDDLVQPARLVGNDISVSSTTRKTSNATPSTETAGDNSFNQILLHQVKVQTEFQDFIYRNQHPGVNCSVRRILLTPWRPALQDGFTLELQLYGKWLQAAVAQDRTFVMRNNIRSAYAPVSCQWGQASNFTRNNQFECLFQPLSSCSEDAIMEIGHNGLEHRINASNMAGYAIIKDKSRYFHALNYGPQRVVDNYSGRNWEGDHIEHWERSMGRFWLRAQFAHYIWKIPSVDFRKTMEEKLPKKLFALGKPYIGMHVRYSDNIGSLWNDFGRDARLTRSVDHFLEIAGQIRQETGVSTLYIATDSTTFLNTLYFNTTYPKDWSIYVQNGVARTDSNQWLWFKADRHKSGGFIAADVEVLRRADYLIGSFQSNVYRLATELNTAYHIGNYSLQLRRHYPVDVEWYEDP